MSAARRYTLTTLVSLFALAVGLLVWSAPAIAAAPAIGEESVLNVASGSATLQAQIDPDGTETTYRFEYGTSEAYGASIPLSGGEVGAGESPVTVQAHPQDLLADTTYHFRVVAVSAGGTEDGEDQVFTTQTTGGEFSLPDGRQWELVSPPNKHGAGLESITNGNGVIQAAANGGAITYVATGPVTAEPAGNRAPELMQVFSKRSAGGWETQDISSPHDARAEIAAGGGSEYRFFSEDLSLGMVEPRGKTPLSPEATEETPYLRDDTTGDYQPLVTDANVQPGTEFGGNPKYYFGYVTPVAGTPDLGDVVLRSEVPLTKNAVGEGLYEWADGKLQLVSVLPGPGETPARSPLLGYKGDSTEGDVRNAISSDGLRIVWEGAGENAAENHLYLRDVAKSETIQLDVVQGGSGDGEATPQFQIASSDGSKVFFTDEQRLTAGSEARFQVPDLYECEVVEVAGKLACELTDLTVTDNPEDLTEAGSLQSVLGVSEDGSYMYFVADGVLAPGATPGNCEGREGSSATTCNLYVRHDGATTFIAALSAQDGKWGGGALRGSSALGVLSARVSPNGRFLAFMSDRSLTGYDNRDAVSDEPDEEVYLYDAESKRLTCASCNPTGARPHGVYDTEEFPGLLVDHIGTWGKRWLAASIPGWTSMAAWTARYQSRYLSDEGRLFFDSADALTPQDTNGVEDVYEYEPAGVGGPSGCTAGSASYSAASGGCVGLISSGTASEESAFLDASESGDDVFFLTSGRLVGQDVDIADDVYDAHVCSAEEPCPSAVATPPACTTADACKPAVTPQPAVFGAPASATFSGAGNLVPAASKPVAKAKKPKAKRKKEKKHKKGRRKKKTKGSGAGKSLAAMAMGTAKARGE